MTDAKLDAAAAAALERAREEARRRQHAMLDPEHLLLALCATDGGRAALAARAVDVSELVERLDARLAGRAPVGGYRGVAGDAHDSARLEDVVDRAASLARGRTRIREYDLVESALGDRVVAAMLGAMTRWADSATAFVTRATALARACGHDEVGLEHALRVLADEQFGVDADELAYALTHGGAPPDAGAALPAHVRVDVLVHNDEALTLELLTHVLADAFDVGESHRSLYVTSIFEKGAATVGTWTAKEARERRARALLLARQRALPLRITLRRPGT